MTSVPDDTEEIILQKQKKLPTYDYIMVFGEGPIKPVFLPQEVSPEQKNIWENTKINPSVFQEPDFWLMQQPRFLSQLVKIDQDPNINNEEKKQLREKIRQNWQHNGWFSLRKWGTQNALAAGHALYKGMTRKIIVTGGKTMSPWVREKLSTERKLNWPTEAELMADIIRKTYGVLFEKKYNLSIDSAIIIENRSTNTLENFAFAINTMPDLIADTKKIALLSANHHLKRITVLAELFSIVKENRTQLCAQEILQASDVSIENQETSFFDLTLSKENEDELIHLRKKEERWLKGLEDPTYLAYWLGYIAMVNQPKVIRNALKRLKNPAWQSAVKHACQQCGINIEEYIEEDIMLLSKNNPEKYQKLVTSLQKLRSPDFRKLPPSVLL